HLLPGAAGRLAIRLLEGPCRPGRTPGRHERLQVATASLDEGLDPDRPQALAGYFPERLSVESQGRSFLPSDQQLFLSPRGDPRAPDRAGDHHSGTDRVEAGGDSRLPSLLLRDLLIHRLLLLLAEGNRPTSAPDAQVHAVPDVLRNRAFSEQCPRGAGSHLQSQDGVHPDPEIPDRGNPRRMARQEIPLSQKLFGRGGGRARALFPRLHDICGHRELLGRRSLPADLLQRFRLYGRTFTDLSMVAGDARSRSRNETSAPRCRAGNSLIPRF